MTDGKGYSFPEQIDPGEMACFKVYVPRDGLYLAAFWGAYEFFTTWLAWARDPLKRGKQVAAVWRRAYEMSRRYYEQTKGVCMANITGIRTDPLNPCMIQVQYDGGPWTNAADMGCCGGGGGGGACVPPLRVGSDGTVQKYNPETGTWENTAPGIGQTNETNLPVVFPGDPEAQCKAANGYYAFLKDSLEQILLSAEAAGNFGQFAAQIVAWLSQIFAIVVPVYEAMLNMLQVAYTFTEIETAARITARDDVDFFCEVFTFTSGNGTYTQSQLDGLEAALRARAEDEAIEERKWWYVHAADLVNIYGLTGANKGVSYRVTEPNDCTGCEWTATIDFRETTGGFTLQLVDQFGKGTLQRYGSYVAGQGFRSDNDGGSGSPYHNHLLATLATETFHCRQVILTTQVDREGVPCYDSYPHPMDGMDGYARYVTQSFSAIIDPLVGEAHPYTCDETLNVMNGSIGDVQVSRLTIIGGVGNLGYAPVGGTLWVRKLEIKGQGAIPPQLVNFVGGA